MRDQPSAASGKVQVGGGLLNGHSELLGLFYANDRRVYLLSAFRVVGGGCRRSRELVWSIEINFSLITHTCCDDSWNPSVEQIPDVKFGPGKNEK
jgi:hypothetical protein